ncbi:MAG: aminotransferase class I/II-fold pyridoxal phosphate-dependent enzyme [Evtepia gabavorous]
MTYSKSRSMAGARLGFALGSRELIADLERLKYATNPYNVNRLTLRLGEAARGFRSLLPSQRPADHGHAGQDRPGPAEMGFRLPDSQANFLFVTHPRIDGARLYQKCRERGILIRHFSDPAIAQYNRVTIGAEEEMETFLTMVRDILREEGL